MDSVAEHIEIGKPIPEDISKHLRKFISESDYFRVADMHKGKMEGTSLRAVVFNRKLKVTQNNIEPLKTLFRLGIQYAQSREYSRQKIVNYLGEDESEALTKLNEVAA